MKRSWHSNRPRMRMLLSWRWRLEFRGIYEQQVVLRIESHGFGAELGFDLSHLAEFVRGILMEYVDKSFPCGNEDSIRFGIIDTGVRARTDRERPDDLAIIRVHHHHHLWISPRNEQAPMLAIDGHGRRRAGGGDGPTRLDGQALGIDRHHL